MTQLSLFLILFTVVLAELEIEFRHKNLIQEIQESKHVETYSPACKAAVEAQEAIFYRCSYQSYCLCQQLPAYVAQTENACLVHQSDYNSEYYLRTYQYAQQVISQYCQVAAQQVSQQHTQLEHSVIEPLVEYVATSTATATVVLTQTVINGVLTQIPVPAPVYKKTSSSGSRLYSMSSVVVKIFLAVYGLLLII